MAFHVIHRDDGDIPDERKRLGEIDADPECRFEARAVRDGDGINWRFFYARNKIKKLFQ